MCLTKSIVIHKIFEVADDAVLHAEDIARITNMHVESVRRWCRSGKLTSYNFGNKYIVVGSDFKNFMKLSKVQSRWEQMMNG
jgi:cytochrome b subunit of formate dehydrogenase